MESTVDNTPAVSVQGLVKVFHDFWRRPKVRAVDGIDLEIPRGQVFGLLGPNGSGKSTTIKILLGLLFPTAGVVRVLGDSPRGVATKRHIGYLPEDANLYRYLTARETLDFYGRLFGLDARTRRDRVGQLLDMVGLAQAADRAVGEFSKGMTRRIGLAQALINDPQLLILDEPTAGLDPLGCRQVKDLMVALARRGKTILITSHLLADVEDVCDRLAIMVDGKLCAQGTVHDLLRLRDRVTLSIPELPPAQMQEVLRLLRERVGAEPQVAHPSMDLEQFFLQVIEKAQQSGASPADASHRATIAPYLSGGGG